MIILNLKNYVESTGANLAPIIKDLEAAALALPGLANIVSISPAMYDLHQALATSSQIKVMAPHVDAKNVGSTTGWAPAESIRTIGIEYSLLNHSEHRFADWTELESTIKFAQEKGLKLVVCCENLAEAEKLLALQPYAIAFEDKDLIGTGNSITTGRPDDVKAFIAMVKGKSKAIIGAGVSSGDDIKVGLEFGAEGFILASAFVKATDKKAKAIELASPFLGQ